jgi:hypothetical protein
VPCFRLADDNSELANKRSYLPTLKDVGFDSCPLPLYGRVAQRQSVSQGDGGRLLRGTSLIIEMLASVIFPICDLRGFFPSALGRIATDLSQFQDDDAEKKFLRSVGLSRERRFGPGLGERYFSLTRIAALKIPSKSHDSAALALEPRPLRYSQLDSVCGTIEFTVTSHRAGPYTSCTRKIRPQASKSNTAKPSAVAHDS